MLLLSLLAFWTYVIPEIASATFVVYPKLVSASVGRQERDTSGSVAVRTIYLDFGSESLISNLTLNANLFTGYLKSEIVAPNGSSREASGKVMDGCSYYVGKTAALQECPDGQITGVLGVGRRVFTLEPLSAEGKSRGAHNFTEIRGRRGATGGPIRSEGICFEVVHKVQFNSIYSSHFLFES